MNTLPSQRGQVLIEVLAMGLTYLGLLGGTVFCILLIWNTAWTRHHLYETLICLNSVSSRHQCQQYFYQQTQKGLMGFTAQGLQWNTSFNHIEVKLQSAFKTTHHVHRSVHKRGL